MINTRIRKKHTTSQVIANIILYYTLFVILFTTAYGYLFFDSVKRIRSKRVDGKLLLYEEMGFGFIATIIVFLFYNNLQRTDTSFILAFFSAIPIALRKKMYLSSISLAV